MGLPLSAVIDLTPDPIAEFKDKVSHHVCGCNDRRMFRVSDNSFVCAGCGCCIALERPYIGCTAYFLHFDEEEGQKVIYNGRVSEINGTVLTIRLIYKGRKSLTRLDLSRGLDDDDGCSLVPHRKLQPAR